MHPSLPRPPLPWPPLHPTLTPPPRPLPWPPSQPLKAGTVPYTAPAVLLQVLHQFPLNISLKLSIKCGARIFGLMRIVILQGFLVCSTNINTIYTRPKRILSAMNGTITHFFLTFLGEREQTVLVLWPCQHTFSLIEVHMGMLLPCRQPVYQIILDICDLSLSVLLMSL